MPSYDHICESPDCQHEWEDFYSITANIPKVCPKCNKETVKRLISGTTKGVVELYGNDLVAKTKEDIQKMKREMHGSEKLYSNFLGEDKYQAVQQRIDKQKREKY